MSDDLQAIEDLKALTRLTKALKNSSGDAFVLLVHPADVRCALSKAHEAEGLAKEVERLTQGVKDLGSLIVEQTRNAEGLEADLLRWKAEAGGLSVAVDSVEGERDEARAKVLQLDAENRALDAGLWLALKNQCCVDPGEATRCVMVAEQDLAEALRQAREGVAS